MFWSAFAREEQRVQVAVAFFVETFALAVGFVSVWYYLDVLDVEKRKELSDQVRDVLRAVVGSDFCAYGVLTEEA